MNYEQLDKDFAALAERDAVMLENLGEEMHALHAKKDLKRLIERAYVYRLALGNYDYALHLQFAQRRLLGDG